MKRHFLAAIASIVMIPICGRAQDFESNGLYYSVISADEVEITSEPDNAHVLYAGVVHIPETVTHDGVEYRVVKIGDEAFYNSNVTDVHIPNSIKEIGTGAFEYAASLQNITLPLGLTKISAAAFAGTSIKGIAIPEGVTVIGEGAFQSCGHLESVFIPSTLQKIEAYGFNNCHMLREIYCLAATPPEATGWAIFIGLSGIDILVPEESMATYGETAPWNDAATFNIYPPESFEMSMSASTDRGEWVEIPLGANFAYKIYNSDDELLAVSAAESYWIERQDSETTYTVVPTNYFYDSAAETYVVGSASVKGMRTDESLEVKVLDGDIILAGDYAGRQVRIYDTAGRLVATQSDGNGVISGLIPGNVYIVCCGDIVKKVVL